LGGASGDVICCVWFCNLMLIIVYLLNITCFSSRI